MRGAMRLVAFAALGWTIGCGGGGSSSTQNVLPSQAQIAVTVSPASANVRAGTTQQFSATVTGTANLAVTWSVNSIPGGNNTVGTISTTGLYTAPATVPNQNNVTITAVSVADSTHTSTAAATLLNPVPQVTQVFPAAVDPGPYAVVITGRGFVSGAVVSVGGTNLTTTFVSSTTLRASGSATSAQAGTSLALTVTNPNPGGTASTATNVPVGVVSAAAAARFLEQSTFGATPALIAHVQQVGFDAFLTEQFNAPTSTFADPANGQLQLVQYQWMLNALNGQDQLRQRVAMALEQIWVISAVTLPTQDSPFVPYLRALRNGIFAAPVNGRGSYYQIMHDITLNPAMGDYLDMVNNDKPAPGQHANENYAREVLQLFTIGLVQRNSDYTPILDNAGQPMPTYTEADVQAFALAFTGWTYQAANGQAQRGANYLLPMIAVEARHDTSAKTLLRGAAVPAGMTTAAELDLALQNIFNDPSLGPFVVHNLIQHLVTSNPSPGYMARVVAVFNNDGSGNRGNLRAVVRAILLDPEARRGDDPACGAPCANDGHLREPLLLVTSILRNLNAVVTDATNVSNNTVANGNGFAGQRLLYSPTVFNYYSPEWVITGTNQLGPEFELQTTANATARVNFVNTLIQPGNNSAVLTQLNASIDVSAYAALAAQPDTMLDAMNYSFLHGTMSSAMRTQLLNAVNAVAAANVNARARTAAYLIFTSSQYQVQH